MNGIEYIPLSKIAIHGLLAVFGAVVHALNSHRQGKSKTLLDFVILTIMSSFSGVMFSIFGLYMFPESTYLIMVMAGMGGFLGIEGMSIIIDKLKSLISK